MVTSLRQRFGLHETNRAFEAALRHAGFTAAADALGVTPAPVGQQIRTLEGYLGRRLFERHPKGAVATPAARQVAARLTGAFRTLGDVLEELSDQSEPTRLAVTMTLALANSWLPQKLPGFLAEAGPVDLRLDSRVETVDLRAGDFDFAIRHTGHVDTPYAATELFPSYVVPVCTPAFAARHGLGPDCRSLAGVPLAHAVVRTSDPGWIDWPEWCERSGIGLGGGRSVQQLSTGISALAHAESGLAMSLSALVDSFDHVQDGRLVSPFGVTKVYRTAYSYKLIWVGERRLSPLQQHFRRWIGETARTRRAQIERWLDGGPVQGLWPLA